MDLLDKQIIRIMQDEFPLVKEPYKGICQKTQYFRRRIVKSLARL